MKQMKKLIALLLTLVLALGLVACGGSTTTTPPDVLVADTTEEPENTETPVIPGADTEEIGEWDGNYEDATIDDVRKYGFGSTKWDGSLPLSTTGEKITFGMGIQTLNSNYDTNPQTVWMEETTGIDVVVKTFAGAPADVLTQWSLMFNGGEAMPDVLYVKAMGNDLRSEYVDIGYLQNVAGYYMTDSYYFTEAVNTYCNGDPLKLYEIIKKMESTCASQRSGKAYAMAHVDTDYLEVVGTEALINTEWLQKLNMQMPTTIDELSNVLVGFRDKDPNGNGKADEVPLMGLIHTQGRGVDNYIINAFIQYWFNDKAVIENGKAMSWHDQDEYRQALIFMNKLVEEKLMSPMVVTGGGGELRRMLNPQRDKNEVATVGIALGWVQGDFFDYSDTIWTYEPVPALADYTGRGGYAMFGGVSVAGVYALTSDCQNPQLAWRLLDWMHSPEGFAVQRWGKEGVDWDYIENSEYKDMAEGNGCYGGTAKYVTYNQGFNQDARWFYWCSFVDHENFSLFVHPTKDDYVSVMNRKAYQNVATQLQQPQPPESLYVFDRTPEEDELFHEFNTDLSSVVNSAKSEFIIGVRDPKDDAQWQAYLDDLKALKYERWAELAQASYDRQMAEVEAIKATMK